MKTTDRFCAPVPRSVWATVSMPHDKQTVCTTPTVAHQAPRGGRFHIRPLNFGIAILAIIAGVAGIPIGLMSGSGTIPVLTVLMGIMVAAMSAGIAIFDLCGAFKIPGAEFHVDQLKGAMDLLNGEIQREAQCERQLAELKHKQIEFAPVCRRTLKNSSDTCMALYRSLYESYNDVLSEDDWGSIDYIIYVYATQRADTLPAALKCLDDERRYLGVVNAIEKASYEVSATINNAFAALSQQLSSQFASLENTINRNTSRLMAGIGDISSGIAQNTEALDRVNNSINMQNALQAKANKSTKALADDMSYIVTRMRSGNN